MVDWHDCNRDIGQHLRYVITPLPEWNDGQPSWAMVVISDKAATYLPINHCPICGERLMAQQGQE